MDFIFILMESYDNLLPAFLSQSNAITISEKEKVVRKI